MQRGDAEMSNKLWRIVRACVEMGPRNPIQQIHDQGAGGNCNVVKEIIYPLGAEIDIRKVRLSLPAAALGKKPQAELAHWAGIATQAATELVVPELLRAEALVACSSLDRAS